MQLTGLSKKFIAYYFNDGSTTNRLLLPVYLNGNRIFDIARKLENTWIDQYFVGCIAKVGEMEI